MVTRIPRERAEADLRRMVEVLRHDSTYVTGTMVDEQSGVYIGWIARKNSFAEEMPLCNERGDKVLVFAGEEYPEPGVESDLMARGHTFRAGGPSYLVHLSEEDPAFPAGLNGRFHGLLTDRAQGKAKLFNDRFGMQRLYYSESKDSFYFAAEAKAILAVRSELREADPQGLGDFVACGCVLENQTIFKGISVLPPGSAWSFENGTLCQKGSYFNPAEWENQGALEPEAYYQELREVFTRNLPRYFNGRDRVGISLTGGLDTRMIMAWCKAPPDSLPCYTFGGPYRDCQDVVIARQIAGICRQPYRVINVGDEFLSRFAHYAERTVYLTDGCAAVNRAADLYANEIAATIAPVRMTGNYGSEILRRLRAFKPVAAPTPGLFHPEFLGYVEEAKQRYARAVAGHAVSFTAFRQAPWYQYGLLALEQTQLTIRSPYLDNDLVRTAFRAPHSSIVKSDLFEENHDCSRLIADGNPILQTIRTDRGLGGSQGWLRPITRTLLEFTFRAEYAYDYGMPQWLARIDHGLSFLHLDRLFLGRHKFCHYRIWYRDALANYIQEILLDPRSLSRPYIQRKTVEALVQQHVKGNANYTSEIHRLITLELIHRLFLDSR